jgi:hypothetical protein
MKMRYGPTQLTCLMSVKVEVICRYCAKFVGHQNKNVSKLHSKARVFVKWLRYV